jgi:replicative DNA helicase
MQGTGRTENRVQEISQITRSLKIMAKNLNVPIVLLSQLSRANEKRDKPSRFPMLSDLRDSGSIEQDADVVIFLQREDYYEDNRTAANADIARVMIAKQRNGPTGSIMMKWEGKYTKYSELSEHDEAELDGRSPQSASGYDREPEH